MISAGDFEKQLLQQAEAQQASQQPQQHQQQQGQHAQVQQPQQQPQYPQPQQQGQVRQQQHQKHQQRQQHSNLQHISMPSSNTVSPPRRDTPHPSEGITDAVFPKNPSTPLRQHLHQLKSQQQQQKSPMRNRSPSSSSSSRSASSPQHHITQPRSPSRVSLEQITPRDWVYTVKTKNQDRISTQITPITLYDSDSNFQFGKTIAKNPNLIAYGLRAGMLRMMNRFDGSTVLLPGHKRHVTDICFKGGSNIMASASQDKTLIIWHVDPQQLNQLEKTNGKSAVQLVVRQPMSEDHVFFKRLAWHPNSESTLIALRSDNSLVALNVNELMGEANNDNEIDYSSDLDGVFTISEPCEDRINDIAVSRCGRYLVSGDDNGVVQVYDLNNGFNHLKTFSSFSGSIFSLNFCGGQAMPGASSYLVVAGENNAVYKLWNLSDIKVPQLVQCVTLDAPSNFELLNHVEMDDLSQYLIIANMKETAIYTLHLESSDEGYHFDSISEFNTESCVISFTSEVKRLEDGTLMIGIFCVTTNQMGLIHFSSTDIAKMASKGSPRLPSMPEQDEQNIIHPYPRRVSPSKKNDDAEKRSPSKQRSSFTQAPSTSSSSLKEIETSIVAQVKDLLQQERQELRNEINNERQRLIQEDYQRQQELLRVVSQTLAQDVPDQLAAIVEENMTESVMPGVEKQMKKMTKKMEDHMRKQVNDSLPQLFDDSMRSVLIPSFEKMVGSMFEQLSQVFANGIDEQLKAPLKKYYKQVNDDAVKKIHDNVKKALRGTGQSANSTQKEVSASEEIKMLIKSQKYDEAFSKVLSVSDVDFVVWTCRQINFDDIFEQEPVPLSQPVILSLMQQISHDFSKDTELKLQWIEKLALVLAPEDNLIAHHVGPVLGHIQEQLERAQSSFPNKARKFRMSHHVIRSLVMGR